MTPDEAIQWIYANCNPEENEGTAQSAAMHRAIQGLELLKTPIRDYLEYCYSGAKMMDDTEECLRISRALWAYDQDIYSDLKTPE